MAENRKAVLPHQLMLEERRCLTVSGVVDVDSFDETVVTLQTDMGNLTIKGEALHIGRLNIENGDLRVEGLISELVYSEATGKGGFFSRLFR